MKTIKLYFNIFKDSFSNFLANDLFTNAAALAYYTVFSLPPMLLIIIYSATAFYDEQVIKNAIFGQIGELIGRDGADQLVEAIDKMGVYDENIWATATSIGVLVFTATTVFMTMQSTLNKIFKVQPKPSGWGILKMVKDRVLSATILLSIAFILIVSLVINTIIVSFASYLEQWIGGAMILVNILSTFVLPLVIIALLFMMIYKWLPDVSLRWKDTFAGGLLTAALFVVGKYLLSYFIGMNETANVYDAGGSLVVIMLWVFYTALIFFFGAEFTKARVEVKGATVSPSDYAVKIKRIEVTKSTGKDVKEKEVEEKNVEEKTTS